MDVVKILVNHAQNGNGGFESGFIPPVTAIERIEVIRGPMSSLYGSDAMGGVVNVITKDSTKDWTGALSFGGFLHEDNESGNGYNGNFFLSGPLVQNLLGIQVYGGGNLRNEDEFVGGFNKNNNKNITTKLTFTPTEKQKFELLEAGRNVQKKEETPGKSVAAQTCRGSNCTANSWSTTLASRNHWALSHYADWGFMSSEFSVYQEQAKRQVKYYSGYNSRQPEITNSVVDAKFMVPAGMHFLVFGGQYLHAKLDDDSVSGVTRVTNPRTGAVRSVANMALTKNKAIQKALFLEDEISFTEDLLLTLGARVDHHEKYGSHWSPKAYLVYHLNDEFTLKGGVAKAFRAPGIREVSEGYVTSTQSGAGVIYGNPNINPETSVNEEVGVTYVHKSGFNANLTVFNTDFKNKLTSYSTGTRDPITGANLYVYDNVGKANIKGVELSSHIPLMKQLGLDLSYTYQHSKRESDEDLSASGLSLRGLPLDYTPKHSGSAKLTWTVNDNLDVYTRLHYQGKQIWANPRNGDNKNIARERSGFSTVDLGANYQISKNVLLNLAVLNLGNERLDVIDTNGGNWAREDGRRYWANMTVSF
ncbi:TonB-dependent receptor domain-containing protein [Pasteurella bettyae]|uniref:TonB-dependent receptor domain-containing protein n=1 Tax=Pasteurella bettyae TaxID=752 RepID=UPI003D2AEBF7